MRDDFSAKTKRILAARVGYHCSNPTCVGSTSCPALDEDRTVNIGVGAHIAAASPDGPRYDPKMTPAERSSGANGIWLCQSCSKLIDSDEDRYTVELLHRWKKEAAQHALDAVAGGRALGRVRASPALDAADEEFLRGLDLPSDDAVRAVSGRLRAASRTDIAAFRGERGRPARTLLLTLRLEGSATLNATLDGVARLTAFGEPLSVVAAGGTGKSTTLLQLADRMLAEDGPVPLLVPLGEWSDRSDDFFDFIVRRNSFGTFYLNALLTLPLGAPFPETKEAVLRMFVQQHEATPDKVEILKRDTLGRQTTMLVGLAVEANRAANTVISDSNANRAISRIVVQLSEDGQIGAAPQPLDIVDCLVAPHLLVRAAGADGAVSFQHQLSDLPLPYRIGEYLKERPPVDSGPVAEAALDPSTPQRRLNAAAAVVGPATLSSLFGQLFTLSDQIHSLGRHDAQLRNAHSRLVDAIAATRHWRTARHS